MIESKDLSAAGSGIAELHQGLARGTDALIFFSIESELHDSVRKFPILEVSPGTSNEASAIGGLIKTVS
jgi:hypothetical protein